MNSRQKGARGEREIAHILSEYGYDCRRGQQYCGIEGEDVVGLPYMHCEVKRVQKLNIDEAMEQANRDAKENQIPVVFHRKNNKKWKVTMELDTWIKMYNEFFTNKRLEEIE